MIEECFIYWISEKIYTKQVQTFTYVQESPY